MINSYGMSESEKPTSKRSVDPASYPPLDSYKLMVGSIVPRPIAFVSTLSSKGITNLAPFSFFNAICADPPLLCFAVGNRMPEKDTATNIRATGEFVINVVTEAIAEHMNICSGDYPWGESEFAISGLTPEPSEIVKPPCVLESPVNMECRLVQIVDVSTRPAGASLIIGEVVRFHVDSAVARNFHIDPAKLLAVGRMGGNEYSRTRDRFELVRPKV
jgi:flavin reductase (DIM6/NTAB) family NADH-FMN oxidoreductase RutF